MQSSPAKEKSHKAFEKWQLIRDLRNLNKSLYTPEKSEDKYPKCVYLNGVSFSIPSFLESIRQISRVYIWHPWLVWDGSIGHSGVLCTSVQFGESEPSTSLWKLTKMYDKPYIYIHIQVYILHNFKIMFAINLTIHFCSHEGNPATWQNISKEKRSHLRLAGVARSSASRAGRTAVSGNDMIAAAFMRQPYINWPTFEQKEFIVFIYSLYSIWSLILALGIYTLVRGKQFYMKTRVVSPVEITIPQVERRCKQVWNANSVEMWKKSKKLQDGHKTAPPIGVMKQLVLCRNLFSSSLEPIPNFHSRNYEHGNFWNWRTTKIPLAIHYRTYQIDFIYFDIL